MNNLKVVLIVFALLGCSSTPEFRSATPITQNDAAVISDLTAELEREHLAGTFDGMVLVANGQQTLFKSAYGYADRQQAQKNDPTYLYDMGSIAKTFTAAAVLQLVANNELKLTDTIADFYHNASDELKAITITQLLGHTSGLDNFHNDSDFEFMDKAEAERRILAIPLIAAPGEKVAYSNAAYTLLAAIVEKVSEQSFQGYVHEHLLVPLNLRNTGFYKESQLHANKLARGYGGDDPGSTTFEKGLTWALIGAGGMVTSIDDLATWISALKSGRFLPVNAPNLVLTEANERWLLGSLAQTEINGETVIQMGGSTDYGYTALIQYVPSRDLFVVLLLNAHNDKYRNATHHQLSRKHILPILLGVNHPADFD
ncbi:serine hydrolase domain-containing protein [Pseudidiomarina woesei]|uniref:CubicO group peptidase, beta-lactamase class C family n=1 Tax=Pseudidiomarina woesei TaxID=1381080 RepID=A0A0K6GX92_9GAMM|nr:serine hydrolase domain-containing protein [Pseudidiomarina woesei]CUA83190.1 CubicO group peptidase, beta-lactamase class C family [Pseudidiomarina woesei]